MTLKVQPPQEVAKRTSGYLSSAHSPISSILLDEALDAGRSDALPLNPSRAEHEVQEFTRVTLPIAPRGHSQATDTVKIVVVVGKDALHSRPERQGSWRYQPSATEVPQ